MVNSKHREGGQNMYLLETCTVLWCYLQYQCPYCVTARAARGAAVLVRLRPAMGGFSTTQSSYPSSSACPSLSSSAPCCKVPATGSEWREGKGGHRHLQSSTDEVLVCPQPDSSSLLHAACWAFCCWAPCLSFSSLVEVAGRGYLSSKMLMGWKSKPGQCVILAW